MSLTTGVSHPTAVPLPTQTLRFQGDPSPAVSRGAGGPAGILGGLARSIGNLRAPRQSVENFFLNTSKEGPMAIVPLESAVIVGRSERAYRRDGLLELQERMTEEVAAAVVWLFGVGFLQKQFEKVSHKLNPGKNEHLSTHIAWNQPWAKTTHVDLNPQEMFARNKKEINLLLGLKSARWLFSVGSALVAVGYLIPKGNQLKTNFILKHLERRKRSAEGSNVQFGDPRRTVPPAGAPLSSGQGLMTPQAHPSVPAALPFFSAASTSQNSTLSPGSTPTQYGAPGDSQNLNNSAPMGTAPLQMANANRSNSPAVSPFQSGQTLPANPQSPATVLPSSSLSNSSRFSSFSGPTSAPMLGLPQSMPAKSMQSHEGVRFGGGLPGLSLVQGMGHLVEQTPYGSILVVDAGIAGGRGYVASKRSPYETAEVLFRDIGSLYFYILCVPHLMKLMSSGLDPLFKSSSHLQPKVAGLLHEALNSVDSAPALSQALHGAGEFMMAPEGQLREALRQADGAKFQQLLQWEASVYLGKPSLSSELQTALNARLGPTVDPGHIQQLLTAIDEGQEAFNSLSNTERKNLMIAVKQAFRHTVGLKALPLGNEAALKAHPQFTALFTELEGKHADAVAPLLQRIQHMATVDGLNQTHSMLRRSLNLMRPHLGRNELIKQGEGLADWLDQAVHRQQTIEERLTEHLEQLGENLHGLKEESRAQVLNVLNRSSSSSRQSIQEAMRKATTGELKNLQAALKQLGEQEGKIQELLPFKAKPSQIQATIVKVKSLMPFIKTEAVKIHELTENLSALNTLLDSPHARPLDALRANITGIMAKLSEKAAGPDLEASREILKVYQQDIESITGKVSDTLGGMLNKDAPRGEGRLFSLAIQHEDAALGQKLRELLRGGILNDSKFLSKALDTVGELDTDSRKIPDTRNADKMRKAIQDYGNTLLNRFSQPEQAKLTREALQAELRGFLNMNRYLHFGARGVSLAVTMACIGWLVPIVQTKMTKQLTGKDKNPGIASAKKQVDDENTPLPAQPGAPTPSSSSKTIPASLKTAAPSSLGRPTWMPPASLLPFTPQVKA